MKAAFRHDYGSPDRIVIEEVPKPAPKDDEALIEVRAASINASDVEGLTGTPLYARIWGLRKPKNPAMGSDVAGRVVAVGKGVTRFQPGDEVLGDILGRFGAFAEYVCAPQVALVPKPSGISFEQAATLPQAGVIALQGIRDRGQVKAGFKVLINGAGGGSGVFAIQLAKAYGAEVTGVDNSHKVDFMRSVGADHVFDYTREDVAHAGRTYDTILDLAMYRSIFDWERMLEPGGRYMMVGGSMACLFQVLVLGSLISLGRKRMGLLAVEATRGLSDVARLCEAGTLEPRIDRVYSLKEVAEAVRYHAEGRALGKVVVTP